MNEATQSVPRLRLGTRNSPLAMAQAVETRARLCAAHGWPEEAIELVPVLASGGSKLFRLPSRMLRRFPQQSQEGRVRHRRSTGSHGIP